MFSKKDLSLSSGYVVNKIYSGDWQDFLKVKEAFQKNKDSYTKSISFEEIQKAVNFRKHVR